MLATTGKPLNKDASEEEKKFYEECKHDYKVMKETAKNVEKLPIFQKSTIFHCPLKCVDGICHRRY